MNTKSGYRELDHTADWVLRVWAPNLAELLSQAAEGMRSLAGIILSEDGRFQRQITINSVDEETLLVDFLNELLYINEMESVAFDIFKINVENYTLQGVIQGARIVSIQKEIKAVTFHEMQINETQDGLVVDIVFDV